MMEKILYINEFGLKNFKKIEEEIRSGEIQTAVTLYVKGEKAYWLPLTDSSFDTFIALTAKAMLAMTVESEEEEE